jgi:protein-S-isoprenylcysteine O-methyltransferase Ste14
MSGTMDWSYLQHKIPFEKNFRWRGGEVSRIEAFTDAVFALSVTLLVVSTQVPSSYAGLIATMKLFPAFALSFILLLLVWYFHFIHFRRYGLEDGTKATAVKRGRASAVREDERSSS